MPLDRQHVTLASHRMLPTYPAFAFVVGLSFLLTSMSRLLATPTFAVANDLVPLRLWGVGFLVVAAAMTGALLLGRRTGYQYALALMLTWLAIYTAVTAWSAVHGQASFSAWVWPCFVMRACWATLISLQAHETT